MPRKYQESKAVTAADIERSIQALNKMAERLWGDGREAEAKALIDALDALNRASTGSELERAAGCFIDGGAGR